MSFRLEVRLLVSGGEDAGIIEPVSHSAVAEIL
jgi:hypothetical protein